MKFNIGGNTYVCDCTDFPFYKLNKVIPRYRMLDNIRCDNLNYNSDTIATLGLDCWLTQFL